MRFAYAVGCVLLLHPLGGLATEIGGTGGSPADGRPHRRAPPASGEVEVVLALVPPSRPEGVAVSHRGELFVGVRTFGGAAVTNRILRVGADGTYEVLATLPPTSPQAQGVLGLATDDTGDVYAALASFDPTTRGVWRIGHAGGSPERLDGSQEIPFPNALAFDGEGNLYASDSTGAIWRSADGGPFTRWVAGPLLQPLPSDPFGAPLPGANGIAYDHRERSVYFANTERGVIGRIPVGPDGSAGAPTRVTAPLAVPTVDGIALDVNGDIHAVLPGFSLVGSTPLVRVDAATGEVTPMAIDAADAAIFDTPASIAFAGGRLGARTVFVTNADLPIVPGGGGPGVVQVGVGVPGMP